MNRSSSAELRSSNKQEYLDIHAQNYYEFGYLRGLHLRKKIKIANRVFKAFVKAYKLSYKQFLSYANNYIIPDDYRDEIQGIAEATGLKYEQIMLQKLWIDIYYGILQPSKVVEKNIGACTSFIVRNHKNQFVHGQTMDFGLVFLPAFNWLKYKIQGKEPVFCLNLGCYSFPMGKNHNTTSTLNLVQTRKLGDFGIPTSLKSQIAFENCKNPINFYKIMTHSYCGGWNYIYSDRKGNAIACETLSSTKIIHYLNSTNFIVKTNTFQSERLKNSLIDRLYSIKRQEKTEELIREKLSQNNRFNIRDGMEILCYYDGTEASICRFTEPNNYLDVVTEGFLMTNGKKVFFGIGNPVISSWGKITI